MFYNIPLDSEKQTIEVKDMFNEKVLHTFSETEYLRYLYKEGRCNVEVQDFKERRTLLLPIGRRGGKSFMSSIIASYETYRLLHLQDPFAYYGLAPGIPIQIVCLASEKDQAGIIFSAAQNHYLSVPFFGTYKANDTTQFVNFQTAKDIELGGRWNQGRNSNAPTSIRATFKASSSSGIRGYNNIVIILDEFAHFKDASNRSNSAELWEAVTPSTAAFSPKDPANPTEALGTTDGRKIVISSPWVRAGKFYELYDQAFRGGDAAADLLVIQAPTWEINPTLDPTYLKSEYYGNPDSFMVEFGAQFADNVRGWIEREEDLIACVDPKSEPKTRGNPRFSHFFGIDLGVTKGGSGTAITITHLDYNQNVVIDYQEAVYAGKPLPPLVKELFPTNEDWAVDVEKLEFENLARWVYFLSKRFRMAEGLFDSWMGIAFEQLIHKRFGLSRIKAQKIKPTDRSDMFQTFKVLMYDQRIVIPTFPPVKEGSERSALIDELLNLDATFRSRNVIDVHKPEGVRGYNDDRSDSLVRAVWLAAERLRNTKKAAPPVMPMGVRAAAPGVVQQQMRQMRRTGVMPTRGKALAIMQRRLRRR